MPEMHLRKTGFSHSFDRPFTKNKESKKIQKKKKKLPGDSRYIY